MKMKGNACQGLSWGPVESGRLRRRQRATLMNGGRGWWLSQRNGGQEQHTDNKATTELTAIKVPVNRRRDGLNFSRKLLFDAVEVVAVFVGDQVDRETEVAETAGPANSMKVRFRVLWEVEVDDNVHRLL